AREPLSWNQFHRPELECARERDTTQPPALHDYLLGPANKSGAFFTGPVACERARCAGRGGHLANGHDVGRRTRFPSSTFAFALRAVDCPFACDPRRTAPCVKCATLAQWPHVAGGDQPKACRTRANGIPLVAWGQMPVVALDMRCTGHASLFRLAV